jgi:hypothetical protein
MPQNLMLLMGEDEKNLIGNELTRLFALQDMPLGKEKKAILIEELAQQGIPAGAIVEGLRGLAKEDLKAIKLPLILEASRSKVARDVSYSRCKCCTDGLVLMRDEQGRNFSLACLCENGNVRAMALLLARWNGKDEQHSHGRMLTLIPKVVTEEPALL